MSLQCVPVCVRVCASLCRECFRKRLFIEGKQNEALFPNPKAIAYLEKHGEIKLAGQPETGPSIGFHTD